MLEAFALVVLLVVTGVAIWLVVLIAGIPGKMARENNHPYADAINYLAWIGVLTLGVGWFIALVWTQLRPEPSALEQRVEELERKLSVLEGQQ
jgi:type VI protein secretion system component VasK